MSLKTYRGKRDFTKTTEPKAGKAGGKESLVFVVQKHAASQLHYDFRLEIDGVLKSWAVPKGPSLDPSIKRLAVQVEDHPFDYRNFEGVIPEGEYGGGTVIIWDEGTYEPSEKEFTTKKEKDKFLLQEWKAGSLKIALHGKRLQGDFALFHTKGLGEKAWLLLKHQDEHASKQDITQKETSVKSGKTLEEVTAHESKK